MMGRCELCRQYRKLQDSHLLPRALYKRLLDKANRNPHPLLFSSEDEHQTSRQARQFLLCSECEQRFHRLGEDWTLDHCARDAHAFKLREILLRHSGQELVDGMCRCYYCATIAEISANHLCYFALSVIWRAAVRSWVIDGKRTTQLALGPYTESFRGYLAEAAPFPVDTVVWVCVSSLKELPLICRFPATRKYVEYKTHFFSIPGLTFTVAVGKLTPQWARDICLYRGRDRPLLYTAAADLANAHEIARLINLRNAGINVRLDQ